PLYCTVQGLFFLCSQCFLTKTTTAQLCSDTYLINYQHPRPHPYKEKEKETHTMFPTKKMLALFQPTNPVPADLMQFSPGKLMRTDGLDVDKTLNDISQMFYATDTASITDQYMHRQYHGLFHRTA